MTNDIKKIDSNIVGLRYAEEASLGVLPDAVANSGLQDGAIWYPLDPNEYEDFGAEITTIARNPINSSRQRKKGVVTDVDASGGFSQDVTQTNLQRLMQGFFFADAYERPTTHPINAASANKVTLQNIGAGSDLVFDTGEGAKFKVRTLLKISGASNSANNQTDVLIVSISGDTLTTNATFVPETVTSNVKCEIIGYTASDGDASVVVAGTAVSIVLAAGDIDALDVNVGEWVYIGGDNTANRFDNNAPGYARVVLVDSTNDLIGLDQTTWVPMAEAGAGGKTIRIYTGKFLKNENTPAKIKRRTFQFERTMGQDSNGVQSEYVIGSVANEFSMNIAAADKLMADLSYISTDSELRDGATGLKPGDHSQTIDVEQAFNTSSNIPQMRLFVLDPNAVTPVSLFQFVTEASITINNNNSGLKAIGTVGSFEINTGDFEVGGELEVYFATVAAAQAVKNNADVSFNLICANDNAGFVYDIPLLSLGGGRINVEKDEPIKLPVENSAAENKWGYTLSVTHFSSLPLVAQ